MDKIDPPKLDYNFADFLSLSKTICHNTLSHINHPWNGTNKIKKSPAFYHVYMSVTTKTSFIVDPSNNIPKDVFTKTYV